VPWHEYQHTVLDRNLAFMDTTMCCRQGFFEMPQGAGLGIEPLPTLWQYIAPKAGS
jgi:galactonate dehydratase